MGALVQRRNVIRSEEEGQGLAEYALLVLLIALPTVLAVGFFGEQVQALYTIIRGAFP